MINKYIGQFKNYTEFKEFYHFLNVNIYFYAS